MRTREQKKKYSDDKPKTKDSPKKSSKNSTKNNLFIKFFDSSSIIIILALGVLMLFGIALNIEPIFEIFNVPLLARLGKILTLGGILEHPAVFALWQAVGLILIGILLFRSKNKNIIYWIVIIMILIATILGPAVLGTYAATTFSIALWLAVQLCEARPLLKDEQATFVEQFLRVASYVLEAFWQFTAHPPYGDGSSIELFNDIATHGHLIANKIDLPMAVLSLVAIFSVECSCYLIKIYAKELFV